MAEETPKLSFTQKFTEKLNKPDELEEYINSEEGGLIFEDVLLRANIEESEHNVTKGKQCMILRCRRGTDADNELFHRMLKFYNNDRNILLHEILKRFLARRKIAVISFHGHDYRFNRVSNLTQSYFCLYYESLVLFN